MVYESCGGSHASLQYRSLSRGSFKMHSQAEVLRGPDFKHSLAAIGEQRNLFNVISIIT